MTAGGTSRVAVVTGGASGMGLSICEHLARRGHRVAVFDIESEAAEHAAKRLREDGGTAVAHGVDVADRGATETALDAVRASLGPIEILVTSAAYSPHEPFENITLDTWNRVLAVNVTGGFNCIQSAIPDMVAGGWGRIVTIASSAAQIATPFHVHYAASKGAVVTMTRAVAREYARKGVTANVIAPHMIDTPMFRRARANSTVGDPTGDMGASTIPIGRIGTGDDIAATAMWLVSEEANYITGQTYGVNGGAIP